jgi:peptide methionine sulfoxide reductase msrA/msrB
MKKAKYLFLVLLYIVTSCSFAQNKTMENKPSNDTLVTFGNKKLPENVCHIIKEGGTEQPFTGKYVYHKEKGTYHCIGCDAPLFTSDSKFDSGSGWPSFYEVIKTGAVKEITDRSYGMNRIEIKCAKCDAHLGHVFEDGPNPTGLRYCVNSLSLDFVGESNNGLSEATFGAGCFWCIDACFQKVNGIVEVYPGYAGGKTPNPSYDEVCSGKTGHAEVARVVFDPSIITYDELLELFWWIHDPTQLNRQGNDVGTQYRSVVFYHNESQKERAMFFKDKLTKEKVWEQPIVTEIVEINNFYKAESYHQDYFNNHPENQYCQFVVRPKVEKFEKVFKAKLKEKH